MEMNSLPAEDGNLMIGEGEEQSGGDQEDTEGGTEENVTDRCVYVYVYWGVGWEAGSFTKVLEQSVWGHQFLF